MSTAPITLSDAEIDPIRDAIADALGSAYDCTRVWSAWGYGTMSQDDFSEIRYDADRVAELADAAIAAMPRQYAAVPDLLVALIEGRRAIGDHNAPDDCYATGPMTGNDHRDLVQCPACSFITMYDAAMAKAAVSE